MRAPAPAFAAELNGETMALATSTLGASLLDSADRVGEVALYVERTDIVSALTALRDTPGLEYQQLMDIAGVDYPSRPERFELVYCLLSLTRNHRIHVHVATDEVKPVPSVTGIWPVAGWLEREVYDMYGVLFTGNADLRRILTGLRVPRASAAQGLSADGLCRAALFGRAEARHLSARGSAAGFPDVRFHEPVGGRRVRPAGR